jgi:hypothetical protein
MLALNNIEVVYNGVVLVLEGVSLNAEEGHTPPSSAPTAPARRRP